LVYTIEQAKKELKELNREQLQSDTSGLLDIFLEESIEIKPKLIVELGVKRGISTISFSKIAKIYDSILVGIDKNDCSKSCDLDGWVFLQGKSMDIGKLFKRWCKSHKKDGIDILFIDTSHLYEYTVEELDIWIPIMNKTCKVFLHDTNPKIKENIETYGVKRALEEFLDFKFNSDEEFCINVKEWNFKHIPNNGGLAILTRR